MTRDCPLFLCPSIKNNLTKQKQTQTHTQPLSQTNRKLQKEGTEKHGEEIVKKKFKKFGFLRVQLSKRQQTLGGGAGEVKIVEL